MYLFKCYCKNSEGTPGSLQNSQGWELHRLTTLDWENKSKTTIRTNSYNEFVEKANNRRFIHNDEIEELPSSSNCQLKPFSSIVDQLLEPDQEFVNQILNKSERKWKKLEIYNLMVEFFNHNIEACNLCGMLIDYIEKAKHYTNCLRNVLNLARSQEIHQVVERLYEITNTEKLFPDLDVEKIKDFCNPYNTLHKILEENMEAAKKRKFCLEYFRIRNLAKHKTQLDAATKECYCINVSLQTIDHSIRLLHLEFLTIKKCVEFFHQDHQVLFWEVTEGSMKNPDKLLHDMKVIEEKVSHLFHTINRARKSVITEIDRM